MACTVQATIGGKFAPLIGLRDDKYNTAVTDTISKAIGKERRRKIPGSTEIFSISMMRREFEREAEGAK